MTITDNGRVDEELVAKGRELAAGGRMPSKRELQRHLGKGWDTVNAVLQKLAEEKAAKRREALRRLTPRKRSEVLPIRRANRFRTVNEPVAVEPWWLTGEEAATAEPLTVEEHPEPAAEPRQRAGARDGPPAASVVADRADRHAGVRGGLVPAGSASAA
jgi:DNA-binding transcriptional MocR family regulator